jgi:hypothetical protein
MIKRVVLIAIAALGAVAPALAAPPAVKAPAMARGSYEEAMVCYSYFQISHDVAKTLEAKEPTADKAAAFELKALNARAHLAHWSGRVEELRGVRTQKQLDADLGRLGAPVVADANAALSGDKDANDRIVVRAALCGEGAKVVAQRN